MIRSRRRARRRAPIAGWYVNMNGDRARLRRTSAWQLRLRGLRFRTVQFNAVGWVAVLAPAGVAGGVLSAATRRSPVRGVLLGAATSWVVARGADEVRWQRSFVQRVVDDPGGADLLARGLRAGGLEVDVCEMPAVDANGAQCLERRLRYQQRDARRVEAMLATLRR